MEQKSHFMVVLPYISKEILWPSGISSFHLGEGHWRLMVQRVGKRYLSPTGTKSWQWFVRYHFLLALGGKTWADNIMSWQQVDKWARSYSSSPLFVYPSSTMLRKTVREQVCHDWLSFSESRVEATASGGVEATTDICLLVLCHSERARGTSLVTVRARQNIKWPHALNETASAPAARRSLSLRV